jgi:hypothetical protein
MLDPDSSRSPRLWRPLGATNGAANRSALDPPVSNRQRKGDLYAAVVEAALPGDVVFFITEPESSKAFSLFSRVYRRWLGFAPEDATLWHTAIFTGAVKERRSRWVRPHIVHARTRGVVEEHLHTTFFTTPPVAPGCLARTPRTEFLRFPGLSDAQRAEIVRYCRAQLGKPFDDLGWRHDLPTYAFGLPSRRNDPSKVSCHGLAFDAYAYVGFTFPHDVTSVPWFNLARYLGHPLGHPRDRVNLHRLYLRDHHLYRDDRFECVLSISADPATGRLKVDACPGKYAWSPDCRVYDRWRHPSTSPSALLYC